MMPISASSSSSAKGTSNAGFNNSGFSVNYGSGSAGGGMDQKSLLMAAGLALVVYLVVKRGRR